MFLGSPWHWRPKKGWKCIFKQEEYELEIKVKVLSEIKFWILILFYDFFKIRCLSIRSIRRMDRWTNPIWFSCLVRNQPGAPANMASVGFGLMRGKSHCTWNCGLRVPEGDYKTLGKKVPGQSQSSTPNWVVQSRRAWGGCWEPTHGAKESVPRKMQWWSLVNVSSWEDAPGQLERCWCCPWLSFGLFLEAYCVNGSKPRRAPRKTIVLLSMFWNCCPKLWFPVLGVCQNPLWSELHLPAPPAPALEIGT